MLGFSVWASASSGKEDAEIDQISQILIAVITRKLDTRKLVASNLWGIPNGGKNETRKKVEAAEERPSNVAGEVVLMLFLVIKVTVVNQHLCCSQ